MTRTRAFIASLSVTVGVATGALFMVTSPEPDTSRSVTVDLTCPEEDSCSVDYDGVTNRWTVTRP